MSTPDDLPSKTRTYSEGELDRVVYLAFSPPAHSTDDQSQTRRNYDDDLKAELPIHMPATARRASGKDGISAPRQEDLRGLGSMSFYSKTIKAKDRDALRIICATIHHNLA